MCSICKHKPMCFVVLLLVVVGGLNWGLVGLGNLLGKNLNVVSMLVGRWPVAEAVVYLLVGVATIMVGAMSLMHGEKCACNAKSDEKCDCSCK